MGNMTVETNDGRRYQLHNNAMTMNERYYCEPLIFLMKEDAEVIECDYIHYLELDWDDNIRVLTVAIGDECRDIDMNDVLAWCSEIPKENLKQ